MTTSIHDAIAAAQAAAANYVTSNTDVAVIPRPGVPGVGSRLSFARLSSNGLAVDGWFRFRDTGITIGDFKTPIDQIRVTLDLGRIQFFQGVRYGNPVQYVKTFDMISASNGMSWTEAVAAAQADSLRNRPYRGADIVFTLLEDYVDLRTGARVPAGRDIGYSTAITSYEALERLINMAVSDLGAALNAEGNPVGVLELDLGYAPRKNDKGQWAIPTFSNVQLLGAVN